MKNQSQKKQLSEVLGGQHLTVTKRDGKTEKVFVRELPIEALDEFAAIIADDAASLDLICDKPRGWSRTLSQKSFMEVMEAGEGNRAFFMKLMQSRLDLASQFLPELGKQIAADIEKRTNAALALLNSSSNPQSN